MINFFLMVNKHGQTRLANYFERVEGRTVEERAGQEAEIVRKCLSRKDNQCSFFAYQGAQIMYRRYASLFFIVGCDDEVKFVGSAAFLRACLRARPPTIPHHPCDIGGQLQCLGSRAMK